LAVASPDGKICSAAICWRPLTSVPTPGREPCHLLGFLGVERRFVLEFPLGQAALPNPIYFTGANDVLDFGFGLDTSLTVKRGWDNATGWGTPHGLAFINTVTAEK
jgi:hypothetical protein